MTQTSAPFTPWAVLLAAGVGARFGGPMPKQYLPYQGAPLYWQSVHGLCAAGMAGLVLVTPAQDVAAEQARLEELMTREGNPLPCRVVAGGALRQDSVLAGLAALPCECTHALIHDAARPFFTPALARRVADALRDGAVGVIPAIALTDTVKQVEHGRVVHTPAREHLRAVQTPQGFALHALRTAHEHARTHGITATDDAALLEACGLPVDVVAGEERNRKITTPEDAAMLHTPRTGFGYDVHRFGQGRPLKLGGVLMAGDTQVIAHSDGDVLLHALMDALLGCACAGDIGQLFPDTDAAYDGADSAVLLAEVLRLVAAAGLRVAHVDCTIIAQQPKIAPQREGIRVSIARLLGLDTAQVNIKATTEEGLGFTGARQGIKAVALVTAQPV